MRKYLPSKEDLIIFGFAVIGSAILIALDQAGIIIITN
jgi:hypothetical protein